MPVDALEVLLSTCALYICCNVHSDMEKNSQHGRREWRLQVSGV